MHACFGVRGFDLFLFADLQIGEVEMVDGFDPRTRYGEAFWRTHHEACSQLTPRVTIPLGGRQIRKQPLSVFLEEIVGKFRA